MSIKSVALSSPATLAEVLDRLRNTETLPHQRRLDLMSGVRQVARLLGGVPEDIPADPEALRRRLKLLTPAAAGMTPSRLRNVRALLAAALDLTGTKLMRGRLRPAHSPVWHGLLQSVGCPYDRHKLSRFCSFASARGSTPIKSMIGPSPSLRRALNAVPCSNGEYGSPAIRAGSGTSASKMSRAGRERS